jgi:alkanesulfonate monooxygenase SsuD/methylene tetrahydromethanopterin reductase-like flavin-dependent oxidoreductase (luciferase family)
MRERIEAMKAIWADDEATYEGKHVRFERIWCWPKPHQKPHPPIIVGGNGASVIKRVVTFGDEWMPNRIGDDDGMIARFEELARTAADAGRGPIPITLPSMPRDPERIERFERAGVHRAVFWLPATSRDDVEAALDKYTAAAEGYRNAGG